MGLLDAVAGAVRGGAGAVGDIADSEIKTNQAMRLQQQHGDIQGQLNSQLSDLNVAASQKIADYQQTVLGQVRQRRAGVLSGATDPNGNIDFTKGRNALAASGDLEGAEGMDKLTGKWTIHTNPWGKSFQGNDQTGELYEIDSPGENHLEAARIRANKGFGKVDTDLKNDELLNRAIGHALGPVPTTTDAEGNKKPDSRYMATYSLALAHARANYGEESASLQPSLDWGRNAELNAWNRAQGVAPNDPKKQQALYSDYINTALNSHGKATPAAAPPPPHSAGASGQGQRDAAAAAAQPSADSAAQSDTARMNSAAGLLSSAKTAPAAPSGQGAQMAARAQKEKYEILAATRRDYSPEVQAWIDAQEKALVKTSQAARGRAALSLPAAVASGD